ncbi:hypothetical protein [Paenibacillus sp. FJAT-27812]|uniref:hypothetical protein n=1 Tax=Paenibacillus sp. FJAT-27812 TaxID=1684143 RepID=UPI000AE4E0B1|nr:hypothetical protein [Paenibacillus sp. FJAT-27812]
MFIRANIVREWHQLWMEFHEMLWEDCLDEDKRIEIYLKIVYHKDKLAAVGL